MGPRRHNCPAYTCLAVASPPHVIATTLPTPSTCVTNDVDPAWLDQQRNLSSISAPDCSGWRLLLVAEIFHAATPLVQSLASRPAKPATRVSPPFVWWNLVRRLPSWVSKEFLNNHESFGDRPQLTEVVLARTKTKATPAAISAIFPHLLLCHLSPEGKGFDKWTLTNAAVGRRVVPLILGVQWTRSGLGREAETTISGQGQFECECDRLGSWPSTHTGCRYVGVTSLTIR